MEKLPEKENKSTINISAEIAKKAIKSMEQVLADTASNDEQYQAYLRGEYPDPRD